MNARTTPGQYRPFHQRKRGFTLVELLVAITIATVLSAIAIGAMTGVSRNADEASLKRNAQMAVQVYSAARAAGATFSSEAGDLTSVLAELAEGKQGKGNLSSSYFQMPAVNPAQSGELMNYLVYDPAAGGLQIKIMP